MNLEKFTDRAKGFLQSAQTVAIRMNHQRIGAEHVLKALLEDGEGMASGLIQRAGGANATPIAHVTLDMRGVSCPGPIVQAKKLLDGMKAGEVLQLVSDCPGSADDITSWAKAGAADLLFTHESGRGVNEFYLRRK